LFIKNKTNSSKKILLSAFAVAFLFLIFNSKPTEAAFSCDSGDLNTTCTVTAHKYLGNAENITGTGTLVLSNNAQIVGYTGSAATITVANLTINSGSYINFDSRGYTGGAAGVNGNGTGGGAYHPWRGAGAGYGGRGGTGYHAGGIEYDQANLHQPTDLGSGGAGGSTSNAAPSGGNGGGAVKLDISGALTLNGGIVARGQVGGNNSGNYTGASGGGSGGSVWIDAGTITGSGLIFANGGNGGTNTSNSTFSGGGGAGGRIAITYATDDSSNYNNQAYGGSGYRYGGSGSIYTDDTNDLNDPDIIFDNNSHNSSSIRIITSDYGVQDFNNFTFSEGTGGFTVNSGVTLNIENLTDTSFGGTFTNAGTFNIPNNTSFSVAGAFSNSGTFTAPDITSATFSGAFTNSNSFSAASLTSLTFSSSFINSGSTLNLGSSITSLTFPSTFTNSSTLTFPSSLTTLTFSGTNNNTGTITANSLTTLNVNGASTTSSITIDSCSSSCISFRTNINLSSTINC